VPETRYQIGDLLGRGGMAYVYSGVDTRLGRPVAIKRLREELAANTAVRTRFRREASAAARLNHPSIVAVFDSVEIDSPTGATPTPIIVMELVDGSTLREALRKGPRLSPDRALEITSAILRALAASHSAGIIHRDIKPSNVLLTSTGEVKVADFGIARSLSDTSATITQTATVMGTPHYMSPEQARGLTVDHRSDLYSVGCVLYELLVGRPPFTGDTPLSITYQHVAEPPPAPSTADPDLSNEIDTIVVRALQKDPRDRYQTADQMRADIAAVRSGHPLSPAGPTTPCPTPSGPEDPSATASARTPMRPAHRAMMASVLALVLLLTLGVAGVGYLRLSTSRSQADTVVPAVLGFNRAEAESLLRNAHLVPRVQLVSGSATSVDTVIEQSPAGGDQSARNSTVTLVISTGPDKMTVPSGLVGTTVTQAYQRLKRIGFTNVVTRPETEVDAEAPAGTVIGVDPAEGRAVSPSAPITVSYTIGSAKTTTTATHGPSGPPVLAASPTSSAPNGEPTSTAKPAPTSQTARKTKAAKPTTTAQAHTTKATKATKQGGNHPKKAGPHPKKAGPHPKK
jgi:eukaryotic-like serine/threonine-protein kinase